jgi:KaiC/GvpD/RAD55 family RecA-like ATPase
MTIKHAFMVTSAINTKFGVYTNEQRLQQTLNTVDSIKQHVPNARIILVEMAAMALTQDQETQLATVVDKIINFSDDEDVQAIFVSDNWDVVKNTTEVMCFKRALETCQEYGYFDGVDRVHKMSGRYQLSDNFDIAQYTLTPHRIITTRKHKSQFPIQMTGVEFQYMSRLWSWPVTITDRIIEMYGNGLDYMADRLANNGYCDIEHMLYKLLPEDLVTEVDKIGLKGNIGPNGAPVDD